MALTFDCCAGVQSIPIVYLPLPTLLMLCVAVSNDKVQSSPFDGGVTVM